MQFQNTYRSIKSKILRGVFPFLNLKKKNLTWYYKVYIYLDTLFMLMIMFWLLLAIVFIIFSEKYEIDNLKFYTNFKMEENSLRSTKKEISDFRSKNKINPKTINIFVVDSKLIYNFLTLPLQLFFIDTDAVTLTKGMIMMHFTKADKKFIEMLEHELIHTWQFKHFSIYENLKVKHWIKEGYPTYKADLKSLFIDKKEKYNFIHWYVNEVGIVNFRNASKENYAFSALMVKHAIEQMHKSVDDLHLGKVEYDEVLDSLLREYNITKRR